MKIFISYRRKSSSFTLLLANKLSQQLEAEIFVDFQDIDEADFESAIMKHLRSSDVFLLMVTEHTFADRIHKDTDWVRKEIKVALERKIPIVLVCENGLFPPYDLPDDIREIRGKQGIEFYPAYFDAAVTRLVKFLHNVANIERKTIVTEAVALPVPQAEVDDVLPEQSEINETNARQILSEAIAAYDANDFAQALFLFEALQDINYSSVLNIPDIIACTKVAHDRQERKRLAEYEDEDEEIAVSPQISKIEPIQGETTERYDDVVLGQSEDNTSSSSSVKDSADDNTTEIVQIEAISQSDIDNMVDTNDEPVLAQVVDDVPTDEDEDTPEYIEVEAISQSDIDNTIDTNDEPVLAQVVDDMPTDEDEDTPEYVESKATSQSDIDNIVDTDDEPVSEQPKDDVHTDTEAKASGFVSCLFILVFVIVGVVPLTNIVNYFRPAYQTQQAENTHNSDQKIRFYTRAIELDANNAAIYAARGLVYFNLGQDEQAIQDFSRAIKINPNSALLYTSLGSAYRQQGNYDTAILYFVLAINFDSNYPPPYKELGDLLYIQNDYIGSLNNYCVWAGLAEEVEQSIPQEVRNIGECP